MINISNENCFYKQYETISIDKKNKKKPYIITNIIKKRGKIMAQSVNISSKVMAEILKETPGLFFSLPKEVFEDYFLRKEEHIIAGDKSDLENFLVAIKEGMIEKVEKMEGSLEGLDKNIEEFQGKVLEKVDFEKNNLAERVALKSKVKDIGLNN